MNKSGLFQFAAKIPRLENKLFHFGRGDIIRHNTQYIVAVMQVDIPFDDTGVVVQ